jgi:D-glycerate 3-kinase
MNASAFRSLWPDASAWITEAEYAEIWARIRRGFGERMRVHRIEEKLAEELAAVYLPLAAWIKQQKSEDPLVLGVNGAQGSGKSTLCDFLQFILHEAYGFRVAGFSIDDLYKTRTEREQLAREVHPLLLTRGVPGTHDIELGLKTLNSLRSATPNTLTPLPAFDKVTDDRKASTAWPVFRGRPEVVIFEGWCIAAQAQIESELIPPINDLEKNEDPDGAWRCYVNQQLQGAYAQLFLRLDHLVMLKIPSMDSVFEWRSLQEQKLAEQVQPNGPHRLMNAQELRRFIMHYERLTRFMLEEMPNRADIILYLNEQHQLFQAIIRPPASKRLSLDARAADSPPLPGRENL